MTEELQSRIDDLAHSLMSDLTISEALQVADGAATIVRAAVEQQHAELAAALGVSDSPVVRRRGSEDAPTIPQERATASVYYQLKQSLTALSVRALCARTGATAGQVAEAFRGMNGLVKVGRKYKLEAGA